VGGAGNDELSGAAGNDTYVFSAGDGSDTIHEVSDFGYGYGNDIIRFDATVNAADIRVAVSNGGSNVYLDNAATGDRITIEYQAVNNLIYRVETVEFADGTAWDWNMLAEFNRQQHATEGNDTFYGMAADDALHLLGGSDTAYGYDGNDALYGDAGNDVLYGGDDNDSLMGGEGIDRLYGSAGSDTLYGDEGDDSLYGGSDDDVLDCGAGDDTKTGDAGNDVLYGGDGNVSLN
jgi:Ca2+-binding RTX toxin-like protein